MKDIFWPLSKEGKDTFTLDRIKIFLEKLGNPQKDLPPIFHIAGTNGKGSTTAYIKAILEEEGYKVHRFISPHLVNWNERIEIAGQQITDEYATEIINECKNFSEKNNLEISYFEAVFIYAILAFTRNKADATVLEVGLGGRLDATNIIENPLSTIITSISYDHMKVLGDTLEKIASEKAGIIKENGTLIINKQKSLDAFNVIYNTGIEKHNKIYSDGKDWTTKKLKDTFIYKGFNKEIELPLPYLQGDHQIDNASGAISALLSQNKFKISDKSIINGLKNVRWNGRLQDVSNNQKIKNLVPKNSQVIIDGSHNEDGANTVKNWIINENQKNKKYNILIMAILQRKDSQSYIKNLNKCFDMVITTEMEHNKEETKNKDILKQEFIDLDWNNVLSSNNFKDALDIIKNKYSNGDNLRIVISGSLYFIGEILEYIEE